MTAQDQAAATDRLRRALLAFQAALNLLLGPVTAKLREMAK